MNIIESPRVVSKSDARIAQTAADQTGVSFHIDARPGEVWNGKRIWPLHRVISVDFADKEAMRRFDTRRSEIQESLSGPIPGIGGIARILVNVFAKI